MHVVHEPLGPAFDKWHLNHAATPSPELPADCRPVIHRLDVDRGDPHDHPWSFHSFVLRGGYEEEVFTPGADGWRRRFVQRLPGTAFFVPASHVHRVNRLLDGPCFTCAIYGPAERDWRYYPEALTSPALLDLAPWVLGRAGL